LAAVQLLTFLPYALNPDNLPRFFFFGFNEGREEEGRVVNRHISDAELPELKRQLELRDKSRKEMQAYKKRIAYLEKLLHLRGKEDGQDK
jgi:hypothetical protein